MQYLDFRLHSVEPEKIRCPGQDLGGEDYSESRLDSVDALARPFFLKEVEPSAITTEGSCGRRKYPLMLGQSYRQAVGWSVTDDLSRYQHDLTAVRYITGIVAGV
jgi:hypothetical protein